MRKHAPVFFSRYGWLPDRKRVVLVVGKPIPVPPAPPPGQQLDGQAPYAVMFFLVKTRSQNLEDFHFTDGGRDKADGCSQR